MSSGAVLHTLRGNPTGRQGGGASPPVYFSKVKTPPLPALVPIGGLLRPREDQRHRHLRRLRDCARYAGWLLHQPASVLFPRGGEGTPFRCNPGRPRTRHHRGPPCPRRESEQKIRLNQDSSSQVGPDDPPDKLGPDPDLLFSPELPPPAHAPPRVKKAEAPRPLFRGLCVRPLPLNRSTLKASGKRNPELKKPRESGPNWPGGTPKLIGPQLPLVGFTSARGCTQCE